MIPLNIPIQSKNCGPFIVERDEGCYDVFVKFVDTGYTCKTTRTRLREDNPGIKDPLFPSVAGTGFLGVGKYKTREDNKAAHAATIWSAMIKRCYGSGNNQDVTVCESWHNYQNFAEWHDQNGGCKGMTMNRTLDIYSPETCVFISPENRKANTKANELKREAERELERELEREAAREIRDKDKVIIPNGTEFMTLHCGMAVTTKHESSKKIHIRFIKTGYETTASVEQVINKTPPMIKDPYAPVAYGVGFDGVGRHTTYSGGIESLTHGIWRAMLRRCYGKEYRPSYEECYVADEWHNFQTFADWYEANGGGPGLELDKDIKYLGNKVYSPDHCLIVTRLQNAQVRRKPQRRSK